MRLKNPHSHSLHCVEIRSFSFNKNGDCVALLLQTCPYLSNAVWWPVCKRIAAALMLSIRVSLHSCQYKYTYYSCNSNRFWSWSNDFFVNLYLFFLCNTSKWSSITYFKQFQNKYLQLFGKEKNNSTQVVCSWRFVLLNFDERRTTKDEREDCHRNHFPLTSKSYSIESSFLSSFSINFAHSVRSYCLHLNFNFDNAVHFAYTNMKKIIESFYKP